MTNNLTPWGDQEFPFAIVTRRFMRAVIEVCHWTAFRESWVQFACHTRIMYDPLWCYPRTSPLGLVWLLFIDFSGWYAYNMGAALPAHRNSWCRWLRDWILSCMSSERGSSFCQMSESCEISISVNVCRMIAVALCWKVILIGKQQTPNLCAICIYKRNIEFIVYFLIMQPSYCGICLLPIFGWWSFSVSIRPVPLVFGRPNPLLPLVFTLGCSIRNSWCACVPSSLCFTYVFNFCLGLMSC
jgi:hypothetical protein